MLAIHQHMPDGSTVMLMLDTETEGAEPQVFLEKESGAENGAFSPDGRYVAYASNDAGTREIYIRAYPNTGGRATVSAGGGREPIWGRNGELYYRTLDGRRLMAVPVTTTPALKVGDPRVVFEGPFIVAPPELGGSPHAMYDVTRDGQRFLMLEPASGAETASLPRLIVVQNWFEELTRRVPIK